MKKPRSTAKFEDSPAAAADAALRFLARREHGAFELAAKLARKGFGEDSIAGALETLKQHDWQSESRYAQAVARHRAGQGRGPRWVEAELTAQRIAEADIAVALAQPELDWDQACAAALRRLRDDDPRCREKLYQRGFDSEQIRRALATYA